MWPQTKQARSQLGTKPIHLICWGGKHTMETGLQILSPIPLPPCRAAGLESAVVFRKLWAFPWASPSSWDKLIQISARQESSLLSDALLFVHRLPEMGHSVGLCANSTSPKGAPQIGYQAMGCLCSQVFSSRREVGEREESNVRAQQALASMSDLCLLTVKLQMYFYLGAVFYNPCVLPWVCYTGQWPPSVGFLIHEQVYLCKDCWRWQRTELSTHPSGLKAGRTPPWHLL